MALALADSMGAVGWDLQDQMRRYVAWWKTGRYSVTGKCLDIGMATRAALSRFVVTGDAGTSGDRAEQSSGNGSIMRLAPVPIRYFHLYPQQIPELAQLAADSSLPTHASDQCLSACRYMGVVLER
jgi:ADP-ribosyl-[dinitrogen reductase] hydrolase